MSNPYWNGGGYTGHETNRPLLPGGPEHRGRNRLAAAALALAAVVGYTQIHQPDPASLSVTDQHGSGQPQPSPTSSQSPAAKQGNAAHPFGVAIPAAGDANWKPVFMDDFTTDAPIGQFKTVYGKRWDTYDGCCDTAKIGVWNSAKTVSVHDGVLDQYLHSENGTPYSSAVLPKFSQTYGRYTIRFKVDSIPGYAIAWLLWPDNDQNGQYHGEKDFPEASLDGDITGFNHYGPAADAKDSCQTSIKIAGGEHTADMQVLSSGVSMYLDGTKVCTTKNKIPAYPSHWVIQSETAYGKRPAAHAAGHILIDWVAAYAPR